MSLVDTTKYNGVSIGFYPCIPSWRMNSGYQPTEATPDLSSLTSSQTPSVVQPPASTSRHSVYYGTPNGVCAPGEHDFELVPEDGMSTLLGQRDRLVLYCRRCGATVQHDLSPSESPNDP